MAAGGQQEWQHRQGGAPGGGGGGGRGGGGRGRFLDEMSFSFPKLAKGSAVQPAEAYSLQQLPALSQRDPTAQQMPSVITLVQMMSYLE